MDGAKRPTHSQIGAAAKEKLRCCHAGGKESWQLSAAERAQVSTALTALFQCSGSVREHLTGNEAERKELQKELRELRAKIKRSGLRSSLNYAEQ